MANKKKQSKVSKKKTKNTGISTEFSNLITIFIGVFLLYERRLRSFEISVIIEEPHLPERPEPSE